MGFAARIGDSAPAHPGTIAGTGIPTVLINGKPAAVAGSPCTMFACSFPPVAGPHPPAPFPMGSKTVMIGGFPALRAGDTSACGGIILIASTNVIIGG